MDETTREARAKKAALYKKAEAALAHIHDLKAKSARAFYALGKALVAFRDEELHFAYGYSSWTKFLRETNVLGIQRTLVVKLVAVASHLSQERATALGQEKAYVLATYVKAVGDAQVGSQEDLFGDRAVSKMSTQELQRQVKRAVIELAPPKARLARSQAARETAKADQALVRQVEARLQEVGADVDSVTMTNGVVTIRLGRAAATDFVDG